MYEGAKLVVQWWDEESETVVERSVEFKPGKRIAGNDASKLLEFSAGRTIITTAQLRYVLDQDLNASDELFRVTNANDVVSIEPEIATYGMLHVAAPPASTATPPSDPSWDFKDYAVTLSSGDSGEIPLAFDDPENVSATQLAGKIRENDELDDRVDVRVLSDGSLILYGEPTKDGTKVVLTAKKPVPGGDPEDHPDLSTEDAGGEGGTVVKSMGAVRIAIREHYQPGVSSQLPKLGFPSRARGYEKDSPANPDARPELTESSPLRLIGGHDGGKAITYKDYRGDKSGRTGLHAFDRVDIDLLVIPGKWEEAFLNLGMEYCDRRGDGFFVADGPGNVDKTFQLHPEDARRFVDGLKNRTRNAAIFYPWIRVPDVVGVGRNPTRFVPPSGHVSGIMARTDNARGVWKAPAGIEATVTGALGLQYEVTDAEQDILNPSSVNCLRQFPGVGIVNWGSRTLSSDPEWRYVPVRRMALFLKESLELGLRWVVFEPNDEELWERIRVNITAFMLGLFREGAFQGATPDEAFRVTCDHVTNPQERIDQGIVTAQVAFAPLKPAEFVVIELMQKTLLVV